MPKDKYQKDIMAFVYQTIANFPPIVQFPLCFILGGSGYEANIQ